MTACLFNAANQPRLLPLPIPVGQSVDGMRWYEVRLRLCGAAAHTFGRVDFDVVLLWTLAIVVRLSQSKHSGEGSRCVQAAGLERQPGQCRLPAQPKCTRHSYQQAMPWDPT